MEFYKSHKSSSYCKKCISEVNIINRQKVKQQSVDYLEGNVLNVDTILYCCFRISSLKSQTKR